MRNRVARLQEHPAPTSRRENRDHQERTRLRRMETHDLPDLCPADRAKLHLALVGTTDDTTLLKAVMDNQTIRSRTFPPDQLELRDLTSPAAITKRLRGEVAEEKITEESTKETIVVTMTIPKGKEAIPTEVVPKGKEWDDTIQADGPARRVRIEDRKRDRTTKVGMKIEDPTRKWMMKDVNGATTEEGVATEDIVSDQTWQEVC